MKLFFGFLFLQFGTVLSTCSNFNGCGQYQTTNSNSCGTFLGVGTECTKELCCDDTNCIRFGCPPIGIREPIFKECSGFECNEDNCCRQTCSTWECGNSINDLSNPPDFCSRFCDQDQCCEEQLYCGANGNDFTCPDGTSPFLGIRTCIKDCSVDRCCFTDTTDIKTCSENGFDGENCAGGMDAYEGDNLGNTGEECCRCGAAHDCTVGCDPNWTCE